MKRAWEDAILEAAANGKWFDHDDDCTVVYFRNGGWRKCKCSAGPANRALDQMRKALGSPGGVPVSDN